MATLQVLANARMGKPLAVREHLGDSRLIPDFRGLIAESINNIDPEFERLMRIRLLTLVAILLNSFALSASAQNDEYLIERYSEVWHPVARPNPNPKKWYSVMDLQEEDGPLIRPADSDERDLTIGRLEPSVDGAIFDQVNPLKKPMSMLSLDVREMSSDAPQDRSTALSQTDYGRWASFTPQPIAFAWAAPDIRYQPLYFENVRLERYGQTRGPWKEVGDGAVHFFASAALLPYHARFDRPRSCDYPLGYCRPGNSTCCTRQLQWWGW